MRATTTVAEPVIAAKVIFSRHITAKVLIFVSKRILWTVNTFLKSDEFDDWLIRLKHQVGKAIFVKRIRSAEAGNFGDCEPVGDGVSEMKIRFGPGYRVYFTRRGSMLYLLLLGGDKSTRKRDILRAKAMASTLPKE